MNCTLTGSMLTPRLWVSMLLFFCLPTLLGAQSPRARLTEHRLRIIHTTDIHGNIYPYDFLNVQGACLAYPR